MRIKMRIWDNANKCMLYAYEPDEQGKREYYPFAFGIGFSHWKKESLSEPMLFTGLHDKHGAEIWEGDILSWSGWKGVVFWDSHFAAWRANAIGSLGPIPDLEIIGTIYENPELLKEVTI